MDYGVYNIVLRCSNRVIGASTLLQFKYAIPNFYFEINSAHLIKFWVGRTYDLRMIHHLSVYRIVLII